MQWAVRRGGQLTARRDRLGVARWGCGVARWGCGVVRWGCAATFVFACPVYPSVSSSKRISHIGLHPDPGWAPAWPAVMPLARGRSPEQAGRSSRMPLDPPHLPGPVAASPDSLAISRRGRVDPRPPSVAGRLAHEW